MLDVPARILAREEILPFSSRLPTHAPTTYLPLTREKIKERGDETAGETEGGAEQHLGAKEQAGRKTEPNTPGRTRRGSLMYGERETLRVCLSV